MFCFKKRLSRGFLLFLFASILLSGCDLVLRLLYKDMAQEKELLGDVYGYSSAVEKLQAYLKGLGYNPGPIDGKLGYKTREALKEFQQDLKFEPTGYLGKKTWSELNRLYKEAGSTEPDTFKRVQAALKNAGFDPGPIDGKLGTKTQEALKGFQKEQGLIVDGKIGPNTIEALNKYK